MPSRISRPKVRSGCLTCKLRRVKCDETKPECIRCVNYWGSCDGYVNNVTKASTNAIIRSNIFLPQIQPRIGPSFESEKDLRYFEIFRNETAASIGGPFDSYVWERIIPQAGAQERFVQDAMIAIGALTRTMYEIQRYRRQKTAPKTGQSSLGSSPDHMYAMALYGRSLKGMRKVLLAEDKDIRMALIACLLIICFEGNHGSPKDAMMHAIHGLKLLRGWLEKHRSPKLLLKSPAPEVIEDELLHVYSRIDHQAMIFFKMRSLENHWPPLLENEPMVGMPSVFLSLRQARSYWDCLTRRASHFIGRAMAASKANALENLQRQRPREEDIESPADVKFLWDKKLPLWLRSQPAMYLEEVSQWEKAFEPLFQALWQQQQQQQQLQQQRLQSDPSPISSSSPQNLRLTLENLGATIMKIYCISLTTLITSATFTDELSFDQLLPSFKDMYTLSASIYKPLTASHVRRYDTTTTAAAAVDNDNVNVSFRYDVAVLPTLFLLVTRCRHRALRRATIRLLNSSFHREGPYDSIAIARIGTWLMIVEERGLFAGGDRDNVDNNNSSSVVGVKRKRVRDGQEEGGGGGGGDSGGGKEEEEFPEETFVIPDHRRARMTELNVDLMERKAHIRCFQRENAGDRDLVWSKTVLKW